MWTFLKLIFLNVRPFLNARTFFAADIFKRAIVFPRKYGKICDKLSKHKFSSMEIFSNIRFFCINTLLFLRKSMKFVISCQNMTFSYSCYLLNACFFPPLHKYDISLKIDKFAIYTTTIFKIRFFFAADIF